MNPYRPPSTPVRSARRDVAAAPCATCGAEDAGWVGFTWWGGVVGPRLFRMVRCNACRTAFDARTGAPLRRKILAYRAVALAFSVGALLYIREIVDFLIG